MKVELTKKELKVIADCLEDAVNERMPRMVEDHLTLGARLHLARLFAEWARQGEKVSD